MLYILQGNVIAKYNATSDIPPVSNSSPALTHRYLSYSYSQVKAFDNSFVIGVGNNIISSSTNGGISWVDISFNSIGNVNFNSVYVYDSLNAIAVGSYGNIWTTTNSGLSWTFIPSNLINPSGKSSIITSTSNNYRNVVMPNANTILITNTIQPYNYINQFGISNIYNIFAPNFVNRSNNVVFDLSGSMNISGVS
jgi:hypothetical protein